MWELCPPRWWGLTHRGTVHLTHQEGMDQPGGGDCAHKGVRVGPTRWWVLDQLRVGTGITGGGVDWTYRGCGDLIKGEWGSTQCECGVRWGF